MTFSYGSYCPHNFFETIGGFILFFLWFQSIKNEWKPGKMDFADIKSCYVWNMILYSAVLRYFLFLENSQLIWVPSYLFTEKKDSWMLVQLIRQLEATFFCKERTMLKAWNDPGHCKCEMRVRLRPIKTLSHWALGPVFHRFFFKRLVSLLLFISSWDEERTLLSKIYIWSKYPQNFSTYSFYLI